MRNSVIRNHPLRIYAVRITLSVSRSIAIDAKKDKAHASSHEPYHNLDLHSF